MRELFGEFGNFNIAVADGVEVGVAGLVLAQEFFRGAVVILAGDFVFAACHEHFNLHADIFAGGVDFGFTERIFKRLRQFGTGV